MKCLHAMTSFCLMLGCGCSPCKNPPRTLHLADFKSLALNVNAVAGSSGLDAVVTVSFPECDFLAGTARGDMNGITLQRADPSATDMWCGCSGAAAFRTVSPVAISGQVNALFEVVDEAALVSMVVPNLFALGVSLLSPNQPLSVGQPAAIVLQAPPTEVGGVFVAALNSSGSADIGFGTATLQGTNWAFTIPAWLLPGQYDLQVSWDLLPTDLSCVGASSCGLDPSPQCSASIPVTID